jgi:hypothetical protein
MEEIPGQRTPHCPVTSRFSAPRSGVNNRLVCLKIVLDQLVPAKTGKLGLHAKPELVEFRVGFGKDHLL